MFFFSINWADDTIYVCVVLELYLYIFFVILWTHIDNINSTAPFSKVLFVHLCTCVCTMHVYSLDVPTGSITSFLSFFSN